MNSVDTWIEPRLFRLNKSTGAPPDVFCKFYFFFIRSDSIHSSAETGQNWGFPTYNWDEMSKDDYSWWRARLRQMAQYFDAFRIDHILGFFRIWEIPAYCVTGLLGRFFPSIPLWRDELLANGVWDFNRLTGKFLLNYDHIYLLSSCL
jgi:4-alpha-glucanotransferase